MAGYQREHKGWVWVCAAALSAALFVEGAELRALSITVVTPSRELIRPGDVWRFFRGRTAPSSPPNAWTALDFDDSSWEEGPSGFGFGDGDDATVLDDMEDSYVTVYTRKTFTLGSAPASGRLILEVDYDDGFVAYLNGSEVARRNMPAGPVTFETRAVSSHEAGTPEQIDIGPAVDLLQAGTNVLAVEGHQNSLGSSDFSLIVGLRIQSGGAAATIRDGDRWVTLESSASLEIEVASSAAARVTAGGVEAARDPDTGLWTAEVPLTPGWNAIAVEALDAGGAVLETGSAVVGYAAEGQVFGGELPGDTVLGTDPGLYVIESDLIVPAGSLLRIEEGVTLYLGDGVSIIVFGRLLAEGTGARPLRFTHFGENGLWGNIAIDHGEASRIAGAVIELASSEKIYQGKRYFGAVETLGTPLELEDCTFQNLPVDRTSDAPQGDAVTVIEGATARITGCSFLDIGEGVHSEGSFILVEDCLFTNITGDNDGVDLEGETDPPSIVRGCTFLGSDDDAINPTGSSMRIEGNFIANCNDHGVVLRNKAFPVMINNVLYDCNSAGVAIENQNEALLINNTIVNCGRGLRLFDLGRPGLDPGGGIGTLINSIIWDCPTPISLEDDSEITVRYSLVQGGWPGEGNLDADPLFAGPLDFHLTAGSPAIDAGTAEDAPPADIEGNPRPCGAGVDLGAYEFGCDGAGPVFLRGDANGDGRLDVSDAVSVLLRLFAGAAPFPCAKAADADDDGSVSATDAVRLLGLLFLGAADPPPPYPRCGLDPTEDELPCANASVCP